MKKTLTISILLCLGIASFAQAQTVRYFSHRGGRQEFDENTIPAFEASYKAGYRGYETDVRLTADGQMVILHDSNLSRTSDTDGFVEKMTTEQIRKVHTKKGNKVMFLEDLMNWLDSKGDVTYVEFEIKTNANDYTEEKIHELCDKMYERVLRDKPEGAQYLFTSGDYRALRYMTIAHPDTELLLITGKPCCDETIDLCLAMGIPRLGATMDGTSRAAVKKAHEKGLIVSLWPGNSPDDAVLGAYLGADFLCTDVPVAVKKHIDTNLPWINAVY